MVKSYYENGAIPQLARLFSVTVILMNSAQNLLQKWRALKYEENYVNGQTHGAALKAYYENGVIKLEENYVYGKPQGSLKGYYDDGTLEFEENYLKKANSTAQPKKVTLEMAR